MISALYRYPKNRRREVARDWARRSNAVQFAARIERGPDAETVRMRALHDAKGQVMRHGIIYRATGITEWVVRRSLAGRVDQFDFVANGVVKLTAGPRRFPQRIRPSLE